MRVASFFETRQFSERGRRRNFLETTVTKRGLNQEAGRFREDEGGTVVIRLSTSFLAFACVASFAVAEDYDPLRLPKAELPKPINLDADSRAADRNVPIKVQLPISTEPAPVILFSHGLGGSRENSDYLSNHWAARGYVVVRLQHSGSDDSVWRDAQPLGRMAALQRAANGQNTMFRVQDVSGAIDTLAKWNSAEDHPLSRRLDLDYLGMCGHSFGALTTQLVSGQKVGLGRLNPTDNRIDAAVLFSPGSPRQGSVEQAFGSVKIPWLLMTGTHDGSPIGGQTPDSRLAVYPALPPGDKYEVVLHEAEHSAFSDRALPGDAKSRNPNHHRAILALSTAFWDAFLKSDKEAKTWLKGDGPKSILEPADRWQHK